MEGIHPIVAHDTFLYSAYSNRSVEALERAINALVISDGFTGAGFPLDRGKETNEKPPVLEVVVEPFA